MRWITTKSILTNGSEYFDENWMNSNTIITPETKPWDYSRELYVEDIDMWEILYENNSWGIYAAWNPYAEFYLFVQGNIGKIESFYGVNAQLNLINHINKYGIKLNMNEIWVEPENMWLYQPK